MVAKGRSTRHGVVVGAGIEVEAVKEMEEVKVMEEWRRWRRRCVVGGVSIGVSY